MQLGDARQGKLADNITGFGRTLRRAGIRVDPSRISLAQQAALIVDMQHKADLQAAFESIFIRRQADQAVFRELFDAYFKDPNVGAKLLSQLLPSAEGKAEPARRRARVREALAPQKAFGQQTAKPKKEQEIEFDAAMTASSARQMRHADFNTLTASEYALVERLARDIGLQVPCIKGRRTTNAAQGARFHWRNAIRQSAQHGGELLQLPKLKPREQPLPLVILVDISGSMERYARMMLSFLHAATREQNGIKIRRRVYAFGTNLTDLSAAFEMGDTDAMLEAASELIADFAGGTCLGDSLAQLRANHSRHLIGRRSLVLIISDGLDTGEPEALTSELIWLKRHSRRLLWLNPLLRFDGYIPLARGAAALHAQADGMLAVHNLAKLQDLAACIAQVLRK